MAASLEIENLGYGLEDRVVYSEVDVLSGEVTGDRDIIGGTRSLPSSAFIARAYFPSTACLPGRADTGWYAAELGGAASGRNGSVPRGGTRWYGAVRSCLFPKLRSTVRARLPASQSALKQALFVARRDETFHRCRALECGEALVGSVPFARGHFTEEAGMRTRSFLAAAFCASPLERLVSVRRSPVRSTGMATGLPAQRARR